VLGAIMRVAYMISASMPGVLPNTPLLVEKGKLVLRLKGKYAAIAGERVATRMRQLGRLIGRDAEIVT
jgi:exopolyphosphatase/guanosine-5'-triphosphate,3'-diphosphate pyrophosphatase